MDEDRIHLLDAIRKLDYEIIEKHQSEPETAEQLRQMREALRDQLNSIMDRVA